MASIINFLLLLHLFVILKIPYSHFWKIFWKIPLLIRVFLFRKTWFQMHLSCFLLILKNLLHNNVYSHSFPMYDKNNSLPEAVIICLLIIAISEKFFPLTSYAFLQYLCLVLCAFLQNILSCRFIFSYLINCTTNQRFKKSYTYRSCRTLLNRFFQNFLKRQEH